MGRMSLDDGRLHVESILMGESLVDPDVLNAAESPVMRMLPDAYVIKIGGRSILDKGKQVVYPLVEQLGLILRGKKLIIGTGGGVRSRHVCSIGLDCGLPVGVLAQLTAADALGNAHILGTLLAPFGVVAIPPEIFGHLLPLLIQAAPGAIFNGVPPYSLWEHPPTVGRIPVHRSDAGCLLLCETFGCRSCTLVKDVDGLYTDDPKVNTAATFIPRISVAELRQLSLPTLPFDRVLIDLLERTLLLKEFQIINGEKPDLLGKALNGEHVGTIVYTTR